MVYTETYQYDSIGMGNLVVNIGAAVLLDKELKYFEAQRTELLKHYENQFVLIKGVE